MARLFTGLAFAPESENLEIEASFGGMAAFSLYILTFDSLSSAN
jgi:hypothetical protein